MATTFTVPDGRVAMAATLWTGDNTSRSVSNAVNTVSFQPDLVWVKNRSNSSFWNVLFDSVRGAGNQLSSNQTDAELASASNVAGKVSAFNSGGFSLVAGSSSIGSVNDSSYTYVGWNWKAGGTAVSNTAGTITSSVSANTTAGFSVVTYTGTGANATVGHGLGVAPGMVIFKRRSAATSWRVYHSSLTSAVYSLFLDATDAQTSDPTLLNSTAPSSTLLSVGTSLASNSSASTYVAYCWAPVAGYSAFGSYTGNGSADGPFIYTGFRPRWVMIKRTDTAGNNWVILDTSRDTYNAAGLYLYPNLSAAEDDYRASTGPIDILSNGLKQRSTLSNVNASGGTYIYAAYAENPLKFSNAR